jgi:hypothetical protein
MLALYRDRLGHRGDEQVEFLNQESEGDDRNACAKPGEEGALVGRVVGIGSDHGRGPGSPWSVRASRVKTKNDLKPRLSPFSDENPPS